MNIKKGIKENKNVILGVLVIVFLIGLFMVTYCVVSNNLDNKIENIEMTANDLEELDTHIVKEVIAYYEGEKYDNLDSLVGVVNSGDKVYCTVTYDDGVTRNKTVYISTNLDEEEIHVRYKDKGNYDSKYGQLLLPITKKTQKDIGGEE